MKCLKLNASHILICALMAIFMSACTPKNITYFQDLNENSAQIVAEVQAIKIEPGDKLNIYVKSKDEEMSALFNLLVVTSDVGNRVGFNGTDYLKVNNTVTNGMGFYTVSPEGTIDFPILGTLKIAGMTRYECAGFIKGELIGRNLLKDPVVTVEYVNTGINIIGEVNSPGRYDINKDRLTILEALTMARDVNLMGDRQNIRVMRMEDGKMKTYHIDLTKGADLLTSPVYYLKQNDIIYVEPNSMRKRQTTVNGNTALSASFWISVASLLSSIAVLIFK